jgi:hypothetical protein
MIAIKGLFMTEFDIRTVVSRYVSIPKDKLTYQRGLERQAKTVEVANGLHHSGLRMYCCISYSFPAASYGVNHKYLSTWCRSSIQVNTRSIDLV